MNTTHSYPISSSLTDIMTTTPGSHRSLLFYTTLPLRAFPRLLRLCLPQKLTKKRVPTSLRDSTSFLRRHRRLPPSSLPKRRAVHSRPRLTPSHVYLGQLLNTPKAKAWILLLGPSFMTLQRVNRSRRCRLPLFPSKYYTPQGTPQIRYLFCSPPTMQSSRPIQSWEKEQPCSRT